MTNNTDAAIKVMDARQKEESNDENALDKNAPATSTSTLNCEKAKKYFEKSEHSNLLQHLFSYRRFHYRPVNRPYVNRSRLNAREDPFHYRPKVDKAPENLYGKKECSNQQQRFSSYRRFNYRRVNRSYFINYRSNIRRDPYPYRRKGDKTPESVYEKRGCYIQQQRLSSYRRFHYRRGNQPYPNPYYSNTRGDPYHYRRKVDEAPEDKDNKYKWLRHAI